MVPRSWTAILFITGQRHTEPLNSIEAFIKQSYLFDREFKKSLLEVERKMKRNQQQVDKYDKYLMEAGIKSKESLELAIPAEVQRVALETLYKFARGSTRLEHSYQMLLLLIIPIRVLVLQ